MGRNEKFLCEQLIEEKIREMEIIKNSATEGMYKYLFWFFKKKKMSKKEFEEDLSIFKEEYNNLSFEKISRFLNSWTVCKNVLKFWRWPLRCVHKHLRKVRSISTKVYVITYRKSNEMEINSYLQFLSMEKEIKTKKINVWDESKIRQDNRKEWTIRKLESKLAAIHFIKSKFDRKKFIKSLLVPSFAVIFAAVLSFLLTKCFA